MNSAIFLKGFLLGMLIMAALALVSILVYRKFKSNKSTIEIEATTIQKSVENISKLMVIEGHFSETYTYQEKYKIFFDLIPQEKKAIVLLNAKALIGYDLKKLEIFIDKENRKVFIEKIPSEEVNIIPDLKFYDIQSSTLTSFNKDDINKVQADAKAKIEQQIEQSNLKQQARQRLVENLNSIVSLSNAMGWQVIDNTNSLKELNINPERPMINP